MKIITLFAALLLTTVGCGLQEDTSQPPSDGNGAVDNADAGSADAGGTDTSTATPDSGTPDTATPDAGPAPTSDAGTPVPDAGAPAPDGGPAPTPDAGSPAPDAGTPDAGPTFLPDPVKLPTPVASLSLLFSDYYIAGSPCGDVKGSMPGTNWNDDFTGLRMRDTNADHYLEASLTGVPAGTYLITYRDRECPGETQEKAWALYGGPDMLRRMRPEARAFIQCNWYDGSAHTCHTETNPGCNIRITVDGSGNVTPAGNMQSFSPADPGC